MSIFREFHKLWFGCLIGIFFLLFILICTIYLFAQEKKDIKSNDFELSYTLVLPIFLFSCHNNVPDIFQVFCFLNLKFFKKIKIKFYQGNKKFFKKVDEDIDVFCHKHCNGYLYINGDVFLD